MKPTLRTGLGVIAAASSIGLVAILFRVGGNDPQRVSLSGTVKVDGTLLERGSIYFTLISPSADLVTAGALIHHGQFTLCDSDPIVPGTYHVRISGLDSFLPREVLSDPDSLPPDPLPDRFHSKSVLQVVIHHAGTNHLEFNLTR
jgi:hypothetical protein